MLIAMETGSSGGGAGLPECEIFEFYPAQGYSASIGLDGKVTTGETSKTLTIISKTWQSGTAKYNVDAVVNCKGYIFDSTGRQDFTASAGDRIITDITAGLVIAWTT